MFDFFEIEPVETAKIQQSEFNKKALKVLMNIAEKYNLSWHKRHLLDSEYPNESICEKCEGCGQFKAENGEVLECQQHFSADDSFCFHKYQDAEEFGLEVENELDEIYELIGSEIIGDINT